MIRLSWMGLGIPLQTNGEVVGTILCGQNSNDVGLEDAMARTPMVNPVRTYRENPVRSLSEKFTRTYVRTLQQTASRLDRIYSR